MTVRRLFSTCCGHGGWALLAALTLTTLGCGPEPPRLYCGAGIRPPVADLVEQFARREGVTIECDYAGSEVLLARIKLTRRGDLYMPGDVHYVEMAEKEGLVDSKKTVCYFVPVILVQKGNPKSIHTLEDLIRPGVKLGLGDPKACAIGRKSAKIFANNGIAEEDLGDNVVFRSVTVNELGNHVKLGALDAAIVWDAVAAFFPDETEVVAIPRERNVISTVAIGVLHCSQHPELAAKFVEFVNSEEGQEVFKRHRYSLTLPD
ncbi:MAG: molybdate ABC transporter substrate-binding protein [Pirellulales bacterium]|nr:molybdate ABC transporter substrate-binding protein [Pirellulales bacterium]